MSFLEEHNLTFVINIRPSDGIKEDLFGYVLYVHPFMLEGTTYMFQMWFDEETKIGDAYDTFEKALSSKIGRKVAQKSEVKELEKMFNLKEKD